MITNTKLAKEFKTMLASATKAKSLAEQEIEKIDAKYRALAEKEKAYLNRTVKVLDTQIANYTSLIGEEKEPAVVDTVFPENNEAEMESEAEVATENTTVSEPKEMPSVPVQEESVETEQVSVEVDPEELDWSGSNSDSDEWPEMAEEWN